MTAQYGIQSIETGIVFARQTADTAIQAERLFIQDNPEYSAPGLVRAVPGFSPTQPLGRSPLVERPQNVAEIATQGAHRATTELRVAVSHLARAEVIATTELLAAQAGGVPELISIRQAILTATRQSLDAQVKQLELLEGTAL